MRQGVPFIAPRQLGAVGNKSGRPSLPSVVGRTGQSGAHRTLSGARFVSLNSPVDRCRPLQIWRTGQSGAHRTVRCTPDSPVPPPDRWPGHVSRADSAADRWLGRPLAHRTVRCTPDSPVNFSRSRRRKNREQLVCSALVWRTGHCPVHTGQSGAPARNSLWLYTATLHSFPFFFFLFLTLRQDISTQNQCTKA
jgi:hypothetical protein